MFVSSTTFVSIDGERPSHRATRLTGAIARHDPGKTIRHFLCIKFFFLYKKLMPSLLKVFLNAMFVPFSAFTISICFVDHQLMYFSNLCCIQYEPNSDYSNKLLLLWGID